MEPLSLKETKTIYHILRLIEEGMLSYPEEEWELDYYDERLIDRKEIKQLIRQLKASLAKEDVKEAEKEVLVRKYAGFSRGADERVYRTLGKAFKGRRTAKVEYFSPSQEEITQREIDIYYLSRRYIVAYCHLRRDIRKFRADRFVSAKMTEERYAIPADFNKKEYL